MGFDWIFPVGREESLIDACDTTVMCDRDSEAELSCADESGGEEIVKRTAIWAQSKCSIRCERRGDITLSHNIRCDKWVPKPAKKAKGGKSPKEDELGVMPINSSREHGPFFSEFLPDGLPIRQTDERTHVLLTEYALWRPIEGEAGTDEGVLIETEGRTSVRSFCTGDQTQLNGFGTITLPICQIDTLGKWQGGYGRRLPNRKFSPVSVNMDVRREGRAIVGELTTTEGTYKITSYNQSSSFVEIKGTGTFDDKQRDITLSGPIGKGDIVFTGNEGAPGQVSRRIVGFLRRLYIADSALPPAVVGQPYGYTLVASSPINAPTTFALAEGRLPNGISLDATSGTLRGTTAEVGRFNIRIVVTDGSGNSFNQPFTLDVKKMSLVARWLPDGIIGQPYSVTLQVLGGRPPYKFSGGVPTGLTLDPNTGVVSGTPTRPNSTVHTVFITDSQKLYDGSPLMLQVRGTTIVNSHYLPDTKLGSPVRYQFKAIGNTTPINWSISPINLGLSIDPQSGELTGTLSKTGTHVFSVYARASESQRRTFALTALP